MEDERNIEMTKCKRLPLHDVNFDHMSLSAFAFTCYIKVSEKIHLP